MSILTHKKFCEILARDLIEQSYMADIMVSGISRGSPSSSGAQYNGRKFYCTAPWSFLTVPLLPWRSKQSTSLMGSNDRFLESATLLWEAPTHIFYLHSTRLIQSSLTRRLPLLYSFRMSSLRKPRIPSLSPPFCSMFEDKSWTPNIYLVLMSITEILLKIEWKIL